MRPADVVSAWWQLVLPTTCVGCGRAGSALCTQCGVLAPVRTVVAGCPVVAAGGYAGPLRAAVLAYKERGRRELADPLAVLLAASVELSCAGAVNGVALVPVPSARSAARRRGGDHLHRLAHRAGRLVDRPVVAALWHRRVVRDAAGLSADEREANLHGALGATGPGPSRHEAVVVDDVLTTGATIREAVRALSAAGWRVRAAAVVARTPHRVQRRGSGVSASGNA